MNTKFTPGPWVNNEQGFLIGKNGSPVKVSGLGSLQSFDNRDEHKANAELMKCAPDMYEMLESTCSELYSLINEVNKERLSKVHSQTETPPDLHDMETCHLIQQLLKRARGE